MGILDVLSGKQQLAPDVRMGLLAAGVAGLKAAHEENNTGRTFARALPMYFQGKQQFQRQQDLRNLMGAGGTGINTGDPQAAFDRLGAYLAKHGTPEQIMQYQLKKMELQKPKEPLKRYGTPQVGINPQTGKPGQFVVDQYTGEQRWMGSTPYEKPPEPSWSQPFAMTYQGQPVMVQKDNRGNLRPVEGAQPYEDPGIQAQRELANALAGQTLADKEREQRELEQAQRQKVSRVDETISTAERLLAYPDDFNSLYGPIDSRTPDMLPGPRRALGEVDLIVANLQLLARGELKGTGPITEGEQAMVNKAVTTLQNRGQWDRDARNELRRALKVLKDARTRAGSSSLPSGFVVD